MRYRIKHPTLRNCTVLIQVPPKTPLGRWKTVGVPVDNAGFGVVGEGTWNLEIARAQQAGLVSQPFIIIGRHNGPPPPVHIGWTKPKDDVEAGVMETPQGSRTINYRQFRAIMEEAKFTRAVLNDRNRPRGWT